MTKNTKIIIISIILTFLIFAGITVIINIKIQHKVENFLETRLPNNITQNHSSLDVDTFEGTITISNLFVFLRNKTDSVTHTKIAMEKLIIEDISYWKYLFNNTITIEDIKLKTPIITHYKDKIVPSNKQQRTAPIKLYKPIIVEELSVDNATFTLLEKDKDSVILYTANTTIEIDDVEINQETLLKKIPATYNNYEVSSDSVFVKISPFENVTVEDFMLKNNQIALNNIALKTKYTRQTLSKILTKERDHITLDINTVNIENANFGFDSNDKLFVTSSQITIEKPDAKIYRDKLIADDTTTKKLYSNMLRNAPLNLTIDNVAINNGTLIYTERVKKDNTGGTIDFSNLNANIYNLSNTYTKGTKTNIDVDAIFMKNTPLKTQWSFDVTNAYDQFMFKAEIGSLMASDLNTFMKPNLKVQLEGIANKTYFTIGGSKNTSNIDMRMNYDNFKVNILNKKGNEKNKLLSAIANIFINKNSNQETTEFREGSGTATRDKTKSFFNYLWLNIRSGLLNTLTGKDDN